MCGRFALVENKEDLEIYFKVSVNNDFKPRYNIAPTQQSLIILNTEPSVAQPVFWGLKPVWFKPEQKLAVLNNVRSENLREKKTFHPHLNSRRCLVLANGFYEWQATKEGKQPFYITLKDKKPFVFAGLWSEDKIEDVVTKTFAIITTTPNILMKPIHDRMPVILNPGDDKKWLEEPNLDLLNPFSSVRMMAYKVSKEVNRAAFDEATLIEPLKVLNN